MPVTLETCVTLVQFGQIAKLMINPDPLGPVPLHPLSVVIYDPQNPQV